MAHAFPAERSESRDHVGSDLAGSKIATRAGGAGRVSKQHFLRNCNITQQEAERVPRPIGDSSSSGYCPQCRSSPGSVRSPAPLSGVVHPGSARFITPARRWLPPDLRSAVFHRRSRSRLCGPELDFDGLPWARTMALLMRPPSNIPPDAGRADLLSGDLLRRFRAGSQVAGGKSDRESNGFSYARRALLLRAAWRSSRSDRLAALVGLSPCGGKRLAIRRLSAAQRVA